MSAFNWKGQPSELTTKDPYYARVQRQAAPKPGSHITYSRKVPHSINTEIVQDGDKLQRIRKASI